jgi:hypothetical protein
LAARWHAHGIGDADVPLQIGIDFIGVGHSVPEEAAFALTADAIVPLVRRVPLRALSDRMARRVHRAVRLMADAWQVHSGLLWSPGGVSFGWTEMMEGFADLDPAIREDPNRFHAFCLADLSEGMGVFEAGTASVEAAEWLAGQLQEAQAFAEWIGGLLADEAARQEQTATASSQDTASRAQALLDDAARIAEAGVAEAESPWLTWVQTVARAVLATGLSPAEPDLDLLDNFYPVDLGIQIDPGAPWFDGELERAGDDAAQAGEGFVSIWALTDAGTRGPAILAALEGLVDAAAMVTLLPADVEPDPDSSADSSE